MPPRPSAASAPSTSLATVTRKPARSSLRRWRMATPGSSSTMRTDAPLSAGMDRRWRLRRQAGHGEEVAEAMHHVAEHPELDRLDDARGRAARVAPLELGGVVGSREHDDRD